jgi:hypothetical protein
MREGPWNLRSQPSCSAMKVFIGSFSLLIMLGP